MQAHRYDAMTEMILSGRLTPEQLVGREISLTESIEVLTTMNQFKTTGVTVVTEF